MICQLPARVERSFGEGLLHIASLLSGVLAQIIHLVLDTQGGRPGLQMLSHGHL